MSNEKYKCKDLMLKKGLKFELGCLNNLNGYAGCGKSTLLLTELIENPESYIKDIPEKYKSLNLHKNRILYVTDTKNLKKQIMDNNKCRELKGRTIKEYVQKIEVNSKNWISKEFIGKLRDQEKASVDTIKTMLKDCVKRVGKTNDVKFELQALVDAMKKLPDGPKQDSDEESGEESGEESNEKIKITFYDIDDPSKLESPEELTDEDKKKYKQLGEPLELIPGEDVKIPEVGDKDKWKFFGFEPDPENMEESGDTYAIYIKDGKEINIKFINRDPNEQKPDKEIEQIKVEPGEVKDEDIPEPPKYAGYEFGSGSHFSNS